MKKSFFIILLIILSWISSFGQFINNNEKGQEEIISQPLVIKINPLAILVGPIILTSEYRIVAEYATMPHQSIQIGLSYLGKNIFLSKIDTLNDYYNINGFRLQISYRWYIKPYRINNKLLGLYVEPHTSISNAYLNVPMASYKYQKYLFSYQNIAIKLGYQAAIAPNIFLDLFMGLGYRENWLSNEHTGEIEKLNYTDMMIYKGDLKIYLGFNIGYNL